MLIGGCNPTLCPIHVLEGKSHVPFFEDGTTKELWFGTHVGFYEFVDGMETLPTKPPRDGMAVYPGGCVLAFNPALVDPKLPGEAASAATRVLARIPDGEGTATSILIAG